MLCKNNLAKNNANNTIAQLKAGNQFYQEKLDTQKNEMEVLRRQFNTEFENIAVKILEEKTKKFTDLNNDNLKAILTPLGENLNAFKEKVAVGLVWLSVKIRFSRFKRLIS
ncbi:MAG: hypothetical protein NVS3B8_07170 [Chitinophagaceae bacterium]